jgi:hypothetical protein
MRSVSAANLQGFREDIDRYTEIRAQLPWPADVLRDSREPAEAQRPGRSRVGADPGGGRPAGRQDWYGCWLWLCPW